MRPAIDNEGTAQYSRSKKIENTFIAVRRTTYLLEMHAATAIFLYVQPVRYDDVLYSTLSKQQQQQMQSPPPPLCVGCCFSKNSIIIYSSTVHQYVVLLYIISFQTTQLFAVDFFFWHFILLFSKF